MGRGRTGRRQRHSNRAEQPASGRSSGWRIAALLAAVFLVKLVVVLQLKDHPLLRPEGGLDSVTYTRLAGRVLGGDFALGPGLYFVSPLYIYFLAATLWIGGGYTFVRLVQIALGTAAVWCVFLTARTWFGERAAWIAAILAALTGVFTFYEIVILQSALDTFLTAAGLWALTSVCDLKAAATAAASASPRSSASRMPVGSNTRAASFSEGKIDRRWKAVLAGVLFGLLILNRPNSFIAIAGVVLTLVTIRHARSAALIVAGALATIAPVLLRNAVVSHQFALVSSQGGLNFYIGNNAAATGQYVPVPGVRANIEGQSEDTRRVAEQATGHPMTDAEVSAHFTRLGIAWIEEYPAAAARLFVRKLALVLNRQHQWLDFSYPYYAHDTGSILWTLFVGPWLLVPFGIGGLVFAWRRPETRGWASFVPFYAVSVALFFVAERYRLPLFVPLCVTSAATIDALLGQRTSNLPSPTSDLRSAALLCVAAAVVAFWPFHLDEGRFGERLRLAKVLMNEGDFGAAVTELEAAHRIDPSQTVAEFNLGIALMNVGRGAEGLGHIRRAVDAGVPVEGARYALANAMLASGDRDGAAQLLRTFSPAPSDSAESCYQVAVLALNAGAPAAASRYLERALTLRPGWKEAEELLRRIPRG
jgi:4-amino-4-deoxy-L-arabinose transferase-like glycosyltransferase